MATIQWVCAVHALTGETRLYDPLLAVSDMSELPEGRERVVKANPKSLEVHKECTLEPWTASAVPGSHRVKSCPS